VSHLRPGACNSCGAYSIALQDDSGQATSSGDGSRISFRRAGLSGCVTRGRDALAPGCSLGSPARPSATRTWRWNCASRYHLPDINSAAKKLNLPVDLLEQLIRAPQMRNHNASAHDHRHIQRLFLLGARYAQPISLDRMIEDTVVAAQTRRRHQSHQLLRLGGQRAFQVRVVIDVVKALYQKITGLIDICIQPRSGFNEPARGFTLVGHIFFSEKIRRLFALRAFWSWAFRRRSFRRRSFRSRGVFAGGCRHRKMLADIAPHASENRERNRRRYAKKILTAKMAEGCRGERKVPGSHPASPRALCVVSLRSLRSKAVR
jgi:hypothetical protein